MRLFSISFVLVLAACGGELQDNPYDRGACAPGNAACTPVRAVAADPRFVGDGMRSRDVLPHWPMFRHDAQHSGANLLAPPTSASLLWTFQTQGQIWSSPGRRPRRDDLRQLERQAHLCDHAVRQAQVEL